MAPKISVIVPVYNVQDYIDQCIQSIVSQTFRDFEVIIVDDGSADDSGKICDIWASKDPRIKTIHQENQGVSAARNVGVKAAVGEFISFVDSDDWLQPQMLEIMMSKAEELSAEIVVCRGQFVEPDGTIAQVIGYDSIVEMTNIEATREILKDEQMQSFPWNKIYKRSLFDGVEYPKGRLYEDTFTTYKLFYRSQRVVCIPYIGYNYRSNPSSITRQIRTDISKFIKRDLDNALAFWERYLFAKSHREFDDVLPICAFKAYQMIHAFIHLCEHKRLPLTDLQKKEINQVLMSMEVKDLSLFSTYYKLDLILYKIYKPLLRIYLRSIAFVRPLNIDLK